MKKAWIFFIILSISFLLPATVYAEEPDYSLYTNTVWGYRLLYPAGMKVDESQSAVRTVFSDDHTRIEVYYDNFAGTPANTCDYAYYSNKFTANTRDHHIERNTMLTIGNDRVHLLKWSRPALARVSNDKHYYVSAEFIKNRNEVYTILIKSSDPIDNETTILNSMSFFSPQGGAQLTNSAHPSQTPMNAETQAFWQTYFSAGSPLRWGIFEPSAPDNLAPLNTLETQLDYQFPFLIRYQSLDEPLPLEALTNAYEHHKYVELTLQTTHPDDVNALQGNYGHSNASIIYRILAGEYDAYFTAYASSLKKFSHPVLFRLDNEMNGDWCWYSAYYTSKDTDLYKALWQYIHQIFTQNGVDNVIWVWNPHDLSRPDFKWNHYLMYYPGDEYVDVIGLTGYNTGTYYAGERWRSFSSIYTPLYAEYAALFDKPMMITEFGSNSVGGNKVAWLEDMFSQINRFPKIKVAFWWSGTDLDQEGHPARIYRLDESQDTLDVFRRHLKEYE